MNKDVVFIHGVCGSKDIFSNLKNYFPNHRSFDLIGFGREAKPEAVYDKEYYLRFLQSKINSPSILIGHSMGAILAKDFALKFPDLVIRIYAIGYPLQESQDKLESAIREDPFMAMYLDGNPIAKIISHSKLFYKYLLIPFGLFFYPKRFLSFWHYFSHTYNSASKSLKNTILQDDYQTTKKITEKIVFITGADDEHVDVSLLSGFSYKIIPSMGHLFFGFEEEIAKIIYNYERDFNSV